MRVIGLKFRGSFVWTRLFCVALATVFQVSHVFAAGKAEHVVVVVWDGLRPDSVSEQNTPTLYKLARDGVFFQNHHAIYLSSTEVNGVALATGAYPNRTGIIANREYRPAINPLKRTETESIEAVRKGDELTGGRYVRLPTLAEILQRAGHRTAIAGTKGVTLLHDRDEHRRACGNCVNVFDGRSIPADAIEGLNKPAFTPYETPNTRQDAVTTRALIGPLWDKGVPKFSLLWLSEPDLSQHATGPGSETALTAMKGSDENLEKVLSELDAKGVRKKTDIFVVSDHGFSTIARAVDVADALQKGGFKAAREFKQPPADGEIMVVGNGGSVLLYVIGRESNLVQKLVEFLQQQDFAGVIFTRERMAGAFTLDQIRLDTADAPDVVLSLRWTADRNIAGVAGTIISDGKSRGAGQGNHASLSQFDMRATLIACGPDFRRGMVNQLPSGNADLVPTILWILGEDGKTKGGLNKAPQMDGRVLVEALDIDTQAFPPIETRVIETAREFDKSVWRQYLRVTEFSGAVYFDEGNGQSTPK